MRENPPLLQFFSVEHQNIFVQQQKQYKKMTLSKFVDFFQICHSTDHLICKQCKCKAAEKREYKEANQQKDATNKLFVAKTL